MENQKSQPINSKIKSLLPEANPFPAEKLPSIIRCFERAKSPISAF